MKIYMWSFLIVLYVAFLLGFLLPALFSAKSYEAFGFGVLLVFSFPIVLFMMFKKLNKLTKVGVKNEEA